MMVIPFSFSCVHGARYTTAVARTIECSTGKSAMLTLTAHDADGGELSRHDQYFGPESEDYAYHLEHAINTVAKHHIGEDA